jgi:HSP20 family protein
MAASRAPKVRQKRELAANVPPTDIYETADALTVVMAIPVGGKDDASVNLENDVLRVEGKIDSSEGLDSVYTEYDVGHYSRAFTLLGRIDDDNISAELDGGVLTLTLKKSKAAVPRRIATTS